jgi:hypothetical protein
MSNPNPNVAGVPPAAAAAASRAITGDDTPDVPAEDLARTDDDGVPVGAADAEEDRRRAGADEE